MRETEYRNNMKIAIDARMIQMSGIGTYIKTLMGHGMLLHSVMIRTF